MHPTSSADTSATSALYPLPPSSPFPSTSASDPQLTDPSASPPTSPSLTISSLGPSISSQDGPTASLTSTSTSLSASGPGSASLSSLALPTTSSTSSNGNNGPLSGTVQPTVCIGQGLDLQATGVISTLIFSSAVGLILWLLFAFIRPRFRQLYGLREWFVSPEVRPRPLSDRPWAFLFPNVPFVPPLVDDVDNAGRTEAEDAELFPSDQELMQRTLWIAFLVSLGWAMLGLVVALPIYLVTTPCISDSELRASFGGQLSTLQDLSLMRLLLLLEDRTVNPSSQVRRAIINGRDYAPNARTRLIILTVLVIVIGVLPFAWKVLREFNRLVAFRRRWLEVKCDNMDMAWLNAKHAPGFRSWGEARIKQFLTKNGLSSTETTRRKGSRMDESQAESPLEVDVVNLFSIGETDELVELIHERDTILNNLEEAEARYIASFRTSTPDPSIMEIEETVSPRREDSKPQISRPRALTSSAVKKQRRTTSDSIAPTSYVAPSNFYRVSAPRGLDDDQNLMPSEPTFGRSVHDRIIGTRFQEVNRDSSIFGRIPLGSSMRIGQTGDLEPTADPEAEGIGHSGMPSSSTAWQRRDRSDETAVSQGHHLPFDLEPTRPSIASDRDTFAMRESPRDTSIISPPHMRVQSQGPFVRPHNGIDNDDLTSIYQNIRHWRQKLKAINARIIDAQQEGYNDIAEGNNIKGWLLVGRGLRFIPKVQLIDGRSKSDIRWDEIRAEGGSNHNRILFWITSAFAAMLLGAGLIAVVGLSLSDAPDVATLLPFLRPLAEGSGVGKALAITLAPAILATLLITTTIAIIRYAAKSGGSISVSGTQMIMLRATFYLLVVVCAFWLIAVGSVIFALRAFDVGVDRSKTVARGSLYMAAFVLTLVLNVAIIVPALLLIQPRRLWMVWRNGRSALTPRQRFRSIYPNVYNPTVLMTCMTIAVVFAAMFAVVFPLLGPAIVVLLFLTLVAHRFLTGYAYSRVGVGQTGGLAQLWLLRRFGSVLGIQPTLLGLILLSYRLWALAGVLLGTGISIVIFFEWHAWRKLRQPSSKSLSAATRQSLTMFSHISTDSSRAAEGKSKEEPESESLMGSKRYVRSRTSMASVLEMMSITLAVMPSSLRNRAAVPLVTEDLDDMTATERAARTHPDAPPHLPPLPFGDHEEEMANILYAPELLAPSPVIWLPNDSSGIAIAEAYDLQRYHDLRAVIDVHSPEDLLSRTRTH